MDDIIESFNDARVKGVKRRKKQSDLDSRILALTSEMEERRKVDVEIEDEYLLEYMKRITFACMVHFNGCFLFIFFNINILAQVIMEQENDDEESDESDTEMDEDVDETVNVNNIIEDDVESDYSVEDFDEQSQYSVEL